MLRTHLVMLVSALALLACDSPSGGVGRVDCARFPDSPACQAPTTSSPDTSDGPADVQTTTDSAVGDDSASAAETTSTPPTDTTPTPDVHVCDEGDYRCVDGRSELCLGNAWELDDLCDANQRCGGDGRCECVPSCPANACGDDGCGGDCGGCEADEECKDGQCVEVTVTCGDIQDCYAEDCAATCQASSTSSGCTNCIAVCKAGATSTIKERWDNLHACGKCSDLNCLRDCRWDVGLCLFEVHGDDSCIEIVQCLTTCSSGDAACVTDCYEEADAFAQGAAVMLNTCIGQVCGSDASCGGEALEDPATCGPYADLCFEE